jgi:hypothetical protein
MEEDVALQFIFLASNFREEVCEVLDSFFFLLEKK